MECLVPLDTSNPAAGSPYPTPAPAGSFTVTQSLASGVLSATFNLTAYGFAMPPTLIVPSLILSSGAESNISVYPLKWTATSFTCNFSSPTTDATYICSILIIP
jgi:hypothetical protein